MPDMILFFIIWTPQGYYHNLVSFMTDFNFLLRGPIWLKRCVPTPADKKLVVDDDNSDTLLKSHRWRIKDSVDTLRADTKGWMRFNL